VIIRFNRIVTMTIMVTSRGQRLDRRFLYPIVATMPQPDQSFSPVPGRRERSLAASEAFVGKFPVPADRVLTAGERHLSSPNLKKAFD
jgi:hypothetical protein